MRIATGYELDDWMIGVRLPEETHQHRVQTGSGAHPATHPMETNGSLPGSKAAGPWSWTHSSI